MTTRRRAPHGQTAPSAWVSRFANLVPDGGDVMDLACGNGRHGRLFLAAGHPVTFVDIDVSGLSDLADRTDVGIIEADLEGLDYWPFEGHAYAGVVVTNYLWRPILPAVVDLVRPGGILIYETFAVGNEAFGKPSNPDFLLKPGELFEAARGKLEVLAFEQTEVETPKPAMVQRIAARNPDLD